MGLFKKFDDRFVDMHIHVLPGIDDGSRNMEMSMEMLRIAAKSGITDMIVTPHFKNGHRNAGPEKIEELIELVTLRMNEEGIYIRLVPGNEILYYDGVADDIVSGKVQSLNGTDRVLVEFLPGERYVYIRNAIDAIVGVGYVPVIAHIERYVCMIDNYEQIKELRKLGAEIQINCGSVAGSLGIKVKRFVSGLLQQEIVDYIGTDAHDTGKRAPDVKKCMSVLHKICDDEYLRLITCDNALSIIEA